MRLRRSRPPSFELGIMRTGCENKMEPIALALDDFCWRVDGRLIAKTVRAGVGRLTLISYMPNNTKWVLINNHPQLALYTKFRYFLHLERASPPGRKKVMQIGKTLRGEKTTM